MRETRTYGSEGGAVVNRRPYPYQAQNRRSGKIGRKRLPEFLAPTKRQPPPAWHAILRPESRHQT